MFPAADVQLHSFSEVLVHTKELPYLFKTKINRFYIRSPIKTPQKIRVNKCCSENVFLKVTSYALLPLPFPKFLTESRRENPSEFITQVTNNKDNKVIIK